MSAVGKAFSRVSVRASFLPPVGSADDDVDRTRSRPRVRHTTPTETKPSFLTTEFYAMIAAIVAVLVAAQQADNLDAPLAWTLAASMHREGG